MSIKNNSYHRKNSYLSPEDQDSIDRLNKIWGSNVSDLDISKEIIEISEHTVLFKEIINYNDPYLRKTTMQKYRIRKHKSKITKVRNY